jgi:hypothetical protein
MTGIRTFFHTAMRPRTASELKKRAISSRI